MRKIRKGDEVVVIAGKDKGRRGVVTQVFPKANQLIVENLNLVKKAVRPNPQQGVTGGIVDKEMPMPICKVMLYNPATKKPDRVGFRILEDGRKVRFFKSTNEVVDI